MKGERPMEEIFEKIVELKKSAKSFVLATLVNTAESTPRNIGARMVILPDGQIFGTIGGGTLERKVMIDAQKLFQEKNNRQIFQVYDLSTEKRDKGNIALGMLCGGQAQVFLEYFAGGLNLVICGAGHIGQYLSRMAELLGWSYAVLDNRPEFACPEKFPSATQVLREEFAKGLSKINISAQTAIVIVTYGHKYDLVCLQEALKSPAFYIGMIGSQNKVRKIFAELEKKKIKITERVYSPIGLDIGADSPAEIAISIVSEILSVRNKTSCRHLRILSPTQR